MYVNWIAYYKNKKRVLTFLSILNTPTMRNSFNCSHFLIFITFVSFLIFSPILIFAQKSPFHFQLFTFNLFESKQTFSHFLALTFSLAGVKFKTFLGQLHTSTLQSLFGIENVIEERLQIRRVTNVNQTTLTSSKVIPSDVFLPVTTSWSAPQSVF